MVREFPNLNFEQFAQGVNNINLTSGTSTKLDLRNQVVNSPNFLLDSDDLRITGIPRRKWELITFVVSWKLTDPNWLDVFIDSEVQRVIQKLDFEDQVFIRTLISLETRELLLKFLYWTPYLSKRKLFGLVLHPERIKELWSRLSWSAPRDTKPVKRPIRKRGYDDKGSKRPDHEWLPTDGLYFDTLQQLIEYETKALLARVDFNLQFTRTLVVDSK